MKKSNIDRPIHRVKVRPYPFAALLEAGEPAKSAEAPKPAGAHKTIHVIYISTLGLIAEMASLLLYVGQYYTLRFRVPGSDREIVARMRVVKTYDKASDRIVDGHEHAVERMCEFHFTDLTNDQKRHIVAFAKAIGQK